MADKGKLLHDIFLIYISSSISLLSIMLHELAQDWWLDWICWRTVGFTSSTSFRNTFTWEQRIGFHESLREAIVLTACDKILNHLNRTDLLEYPGPFRYSVSQGIISVLIFTLPTPIVRSRHWPSYSRTTVASRDIILPSAFPNWPLPPPPECLGRRRYRDLHFSTILQER